MWWYIILLWRRVERGGRGGEEEEGGREGHNGDHICHYTNSTPTFNQPNTYVRVQDFLLLLPCQQCLE